MRLFRPNIKRMLKKRDVKGLIMAVNDEERAVRLAAIEALGEIGDLRAVEPLITALQDGSWGVRSYAAAALGAIGDARAVKPLSALIRDSKKVVRKAAAEALAKIGPSADPESQGWYLVALEQWDRVVLLGEAAVEPLIAALGNGEIDAARALGEIGSARATEPLVSVLNDRDRDLRKAAARALEQIGLPSDPLMLAWYAVEVGDWDQVDLLGAATVEPLIFKLTEYQHIGNGYTARDAAWRLQALYRSGSLSDVDKQRILAVKSVMAKPHMDHSEVFDEEDPPLTEHEDYGIGVDL
jgi:HEAT repeat protein